MDFLYCNLYILFIHIFLYMLSLSIIAHSLKRGGYNCWYGQIDSSLFPIIALKRTIIHFLFVWILVTVHCEISKIINLFNFSGSNLDSSWQNPSSSQSNLNLANNPLLAAFQQQYAAGGKTTVSHFNVIILLIKIIN